MACGTLRVSPCAGQGASGRLQVGAECGPGYYHGTAGLLLEAGGAFSEARPLPSQSLLEKCMPAPHPPRLVPVPLWTGRDKARAGRLSAAASTALCSPISLSAVTP